MESSTDKKPTVIIGCDHAAYDMKEVVKSHVISLGYEVEDIGATNAEESVRNHTLQNRLIIHYLEKQ